MQKMIKTSLIAAVAIACFVALLTFHSAAQEEQRVNEVYQAQAMGQNTQFGKTFNVTVNIERYSSPEERQVLVGAFQQAGSKACSMPSKKCAPREDSLLRVLWATTSASSVEFPPTLATKFASSPIAQSVSARPGSMVARWTTTSRPSNWISATRKIRAPASCFPPASSRSIRKRTNSKSKTIKTSGNFKTLWTGARSDALRLLGVGYGSSLLRSSRPSVSTSPTPALNLHRTKFPHPYYRKREPRARIRIPLGQPKWPASWKPSIRASSSMTIAATSFSPMPSSRK